MGNLWRHITYYHWVLGIIALVGLVGFALLTSRQRRSSSIILSIAIIVIVATYEIVASMLASLKSPNSWLYNIFNGHVAAILFLLLIRSFLKRKSHKNWVSLFIGLFLLISLILHLTGIAQFNDTGEYISFINSILILICCGFYFFELITHGEFLDINPVKEFSFWASTTILFYFSSSFMIYISHKYLYTYHLDIYYMVIKIPIHMALLCNLLLCFGIYSLVIKNRFQKEILHV